MQRAFKSTAGGVIRFCSKAPSEVKACVKQEDYYVL